MPTISLLAFTDKNAAQDFYDHRVVESAEVDGLIIKTAGSIVLSKDDGAFQDLAGGSDCFLVVTYNHGTGITVDSGPPVAGGATDGG